ncbi:hypothetical protein FNH04_26885 [Streptomyces phyllanthi]|uniref:Uncharacterized protein n=1 Tax=Streptomyces phyllanthi TaxID=1803180 RepID=A0A5N8WAF0_9ACTN|nr:hypothetical protein [Streptomyces phyllanthi]
MTKLHTSEAVTGAGDRSRPRTPLPALCVTQITSWGIVYYASWRRQHAWRRERGSEGLAAPGVLMSVGFRGRGSVTAVQRVHGAEPDFGVLG